MNFKEVEKHLYTVRKVRYNISGEEKTVTGIVSCAYGYQSIDESRIKITKFDGQDQRINLSSIIDFSIVRLHNEKLRKEVLLYIEMVRECDNATRILSKVPGKMKDVLNNILSLNGFLDVETFKIQLKNELKSIPLIAKFMSCGYDIDIHAYDGKFHSINLRKDCDLDRWPSPEKYSFVRREYDNTLHIDDEIPSYEKTLKAEAHRRCNVKIKSKDETMPWYYEDSLYLSDKTLGYQSVLSFAFGSLELTEKTIETVVKKINKVKF